MPCKWCQSPALNLSQEVWFCPGCGRGESIHRYDATVYGEAYANSYLARGETDTGQRLCLARVGLVSLFLPLGKRLADFGCGSGDFLKHTAPYWQAQGVEADEASASLAQRRSGCPVRSAIQQQVDAITFFDSLEHLENLDGQMPRFKEALSPNGWIIVTMPELPYSFSATRDEAYLAREFKGWRHNKPREHLAYFTLQGFERFLERHGFIVEYKSNTESFLRFNPQNPQRNIMVFVARKA